MSVKRAQRDPVITAEYKLVDPNERETYPPAFDLVLLLLEEEKVLPGWYIGANQWGGYRIKEGMKVRGWKRKYGLY